MESCSFQETLTIGHIFRNFRLILFRLSQDPDTLSSFRRLPTSKNGNNLIGADHVLGSIHKLRTLKNV